MELKSGMMICTLKVRVTILEVSAENISPVCLQRNEELLQCSKEMPASSNRKGESDLHSPGAAKPWRGTGTPTVNAQPSSPERAARYTYQMRSSS